MGSYFTVMILGIVNSAKLLNAQAAGLWLIQVLKQNIVATDLDAFKAANPPVTNPSTGNVTQVECD